MGHCVDRHVPKRHANAARANTTAKNRWDTAVVLDNGIRIQIGVTDRYVGQSYPLVDTTGADRIRTFASAEIRMIGDLLFIRR